ncbi:MAG: hypothetical protein HY319_13155 [Armatimonadetes bacterium]|nr:hypothetical protein [Armatimonadota bacterium]
MQNCRLIVAAFREQGGCPGPEDSAVLHERARQLVQELGLHPTRIEPVLDPRRFAVILHCDSDRCGSPDLLLLREQLTARGQALGLSFRVQREDLFMAMHRV